MAFAGSYGDLVSKENRGTPYADELPPSQQIVESHLKEFGRIRSTFGTSIEDILSKLETQGWYEVCHALLVFTSWKSLHRLPLSETEYMIRGCLGIVAEVNNGGFHQYFFNSSGDLWPYVMKMVSAGNDEEGVRIFKGVLSIFPDGAPAIDRGERWEQLDLIREADENGMWAHFSKYDELYYEHTFPDDATFTSVLLSRKADISLVWPD